LKQNKPLLVSDQACLEIHTLFSSANSISHNKIWTQKNRKDKNIILLSVWFTFTRRYRDGVLVVKRTGRVSHQAITFLMWYWY